MKESVFYDTRKVKDMKDLLLQSERLFGDRHAFKIKDKKGDYQGITYRQFIADVDALGTALWEMDLKDTNIAVISENRYEWCVSYMAVVCGLGTVVPLDRQLPIHEVANLLNRSSASVLIFTGKMTEDIYQVMKMAESVKYFIHMDAEEDTQEFLSYKQLIAKGRDMIHRGNASYQQAQVDAEGMSILLFTSGTTDIAKGVMLSQQNICSNIASVCSVVKLTEEDSVLSILPLHHTYECTCGFLGMIYNGGTITFNEGLKHIAKNLKETKPTVLVLVPLILENMYRKIWEQASKKRGMKLKINFAMKLGDVVQKALKVDIRKKLFHAVHDTLGGRVRLVLTGAAGIEPDVSRGFRKMGIPVLQGYGLTECSPLVAGNNDREYRDGSIGLPIPGLEVQVDQPNEQGIGELIVKGPNVMLGYYKNEEATHNVIKKGWFHTGDLGYRDENGFLYIAGRIKNVIVTKNGKNIYPEEVESYLNKNPYIQESLVWGEYDKLSGETRVNAQILPNLETIKEKLKVPSITLDDIKSVLNEAVKNVNKSMPLYKHVKSFTVRETEFVKTTTKKIKRYVETLDQKNEVNYY